MADPSSYSNLELWLKGDAGVYQDDAATTPATSNGDPIAVWQDQSGNGNDATQTTSGNRPTLDTSGLNGHNLVAFDYTASQYLDLPNFLTGFTVGELWALIRKNADPASGSSSAGLWRFGSEGTNPDNFPATDGSIYLSVGSNSRKSCGNPSPNLTYWTLLRVLSKSSEFTVWLNLGQFFTTGTNTVGWTTTPNLGQSLGSRFLDGAIVELWLYSAERSLAERNALGAYLAGRYDLLKGTILNVNRLFGRRGGVAGGGTGTGAVPLPYGHSISG